jgi:hypothetical protein
MMRLDNVKVLELGVPNRNGRIYPKHLMESAISKFLTPSFGCVGMESGLTEASHIVDNVRVELDENGLVYCVKVDIETIDTDNGKLLESLSEVVDIKDNFRVCGIGSIKDGVVQDDYRMVSINYTSNPS